MEILINRDYLSEALSVAGRGVTSKVIKMVATKDGLTLIGRQADLVIQKVITRRANNEEILIVRQPGIVIVSANYMREIVKKLPKDIHLKVDGHQKVTLQSGDVVLHLNGFHPDTDPSLPDIQEKYSVTISVSTIIEMIKQTAFAVSKSEARPFLTGVQFLFEKDWLTFAATNSQRLAIRRQKIDSDIEGAYIVPRSALDEVIKLFDTQNSGIIDISLTENYMIFKSNSTALYARLIDGKFPSVTGLIPTVAETVITMNTRNLLMGIDRAFLFANKLQNNTITLELKGPTHLRISSMASEVGKIEETQAVTTITELTDLSISLDGRFFMDAIKAIKQEVVSLSFGGPMRPVLIQPAGSTENDHIHLISPVRSR